MALHTKTYTDADVVRIFCNHLDKRERANVVLFFVIYSSVLLTKSALSDLLNFLPFKKLGRLFLLVLNALDIVNSTDPFLISQLFFGRMFTEVARCIKIELSDQDGRGGRSRPATGPPITLPTLPPIFESELTPAGTPAPAPAIAAMVPPPVLTQCFPPRDEEEARECGWDEFRIDNVFVRGFNDVGPTIFSPLEQFFSGLPEFSSLPLVTVPDLVSQPVPTSEDGSPGPLRIDIRRGIGDPGVE